MNVDLAYRFGRPPIGGAADDAALEAAGVGLAARCSVAESARSAPRSTAPRVKIEELVRGSLMVV